MDSFFFHNVTSQKSNSITIRKMAEFFRFFEICVALLLLTWFSTKLPITFKFFSQYFQNISSLLFSPRFVFFIGNAIILTLFAKSGQFSSENPTSSTDLYDEYIKNSQSRHKIMNAEPEAEQESNVLPPPADEEFLLKKEVPREEPSEIIVCEDKQMLVAEKKKTDSVTKKYQRSQSENVKREKAVAKKELRRSKTEKSCEDEMSNEEFQRKIEEFIAKQVKFLREESMAVVTNNNN